MAMTRADMIAFIERGINEGLSSKDITAGLKKAGFRSEKTGSFLTDGAVRQRIWELKKLQKASGSTPQLLSLIEQILDVPDMPAQSRIDLINQLRKGKFGRQ